MIKIATVGSGVIVDEFLEAVKTVKSIICSAVVSRSRENASRLAQKYQIDKIYTDYLAILQDTEIDVIYLAVPNSLHHSYAKEALLAGKHVICEKPFTSTFQEAKELIKITKEKRVFLFEAITTLHLPNYKKVAKLLPDIGELKLVQINFSQYSSRYDALMAGEVKNVFNPAFSGGALLDINIYNLHFILGLFGKPNQVKYLANRAFNGIDTSGILTLAYDSFLCTCIGAKDSSSPNFAILQGTKGYIKVNGSTNQCAEIELKTKNGIISYNEQERTNRMVYELEYFAKLLEGNEWERSLLDLEHSLLVVKTSEAARREAGILFPADIV